MKNSKSDAPLKLSKRTMRDRLQGKVFIVPSLVTAAGLFCGFLAIIYAFKGNFVDATKAICAAFIFDGLDGQVARRLKATSEFGREYDSLSDVIAFGIAPAVLMYSWGFAEIADEFGVLVCFFFAVCGATRLARFNVRTVSDPKGHFEGLPIPAGAACIAALIYYAPEAITNDVSVGCAAAFMLVLSLLMVSTFAYPGIKNLKLGNVAPRLVVLAVSAVVALVWYNPKKGLLIGCVLYVLSGPGYMLLMRYSPRLVAQQKRFWGLKAPKIVEEREAS